jgi:putative flippase GtrA
VPPSLLGFGLISGFTFGVDLVLLTIMYGVLGWPSPVAVTLGYAAAFGLSFLLNRWLNFRSHAPVGPQAGRYVAAVAVNYVAFILGVGSGLVALGVQYHVARLVAGACEGVFMYCVMRWIVFPTSVAAGPAETPAPPRRVPPPRS